MSSIVGIQGNFKGNDLIKMLKASKNRGLDSTGIFLKKIQQNIDLYEYQDNSTYHIALGHNLLSITDSDNQPVSGNNLVLILDGAVYNFKTIRNFLTKAGVEENIQSDAEAILYLIDYFNNDNLIEAILSAVKLLDGDYSFALWDGDNLAIVRDPLGVKPLFYSINNDFSAFASSRDSLHDISCENIHTLKPGHILFNWNIYSFENIHEKRMYVDKNKLEKLLKLSVSKRIEGLNDVGVIFSGGVDSSILALFLKKISLNKKLNITLYAVGSENSKDIKAAKYGAEYLNIPLKTQIITEKLIKKHLPEVTHAIADDNLMKIGVGLTTYFATKMIHEDGLKVAISGQGADELFGGYNRYLKSFSEKTLESDIRKDISDMYHVNLERDDACAMLNSVELRLPFLDKKLVEFAINLPAENKISGSDDALRKNILRKLAYDEGLDDAIAFRPKKAAQYGTGIDKILRKKILNKVDLSGFLQ